MNYNILGANQVRLGQVVLLDCIGTCDKCENAFKLTRTLGLCAAIGPKIINFLLSNPQRCTRCNRLIREVNVAMKRSYA